jgi:hypothetical protein
LNSILNIDNFNSEFDVEESYLKFIKHAVDKIKRQIKPDHSGLSSTKYSEYFLEVILLYCIYSKYFGSLTKDWNEKRYKYAESIEILHKIDLIIPETKTIVEEIKKAYRDISEVLVHIIDLKYIYMNQLDVFITNIWSSWATVPIVSNNLRHYILRSLLIIATAKQGTPSIRYLESIRTLKQILENISMNNIKSPLFSNLIKIISDEKEIKRLKMRFQNCLPIADLGTVFLSGYMDAYIDKSDPLVITSDNRYYDINHGEFSKYKIISKIRFIFDQLNQTLSLKIDEQRDLTEYDSAWLLLALSSNNN